MGDFTPLPNGLIAFGPNANCTLDVCPIEWSILQYKPSVPASGIFITLFGLFLLIHVFEGLRYKTWGFMAAMISGCLLEIIGYGGRLLIHDDPFDFNGFLMQIICITVAPVFFSAAIYVLLSQVINLLDPSLSRLNPRLFYWMFIPCDIISLVLQAVGGALSCVGDTKAAIQHGVDVSLAGLIFQVITLVTFCAFFADYLIIYVRRGARHHLTARMRIFLGFLFLSIVFILVRCCYRIVELHEGYFSEMFRDEPLFIALESGFMAIATLALNIGHPGLVFGNRSRSVEEDKERSASETSLAVLGNHHREDTT